MVFGAVASLLNPGFRLVYRVGHRAVRALWRAQKPTTEGALVALWLRGEVMIVKPSYRREYSFPGGHKSDNESPAEAAARELQEEVGLKIPASELQEVGLIERTFEHRNDRVYLFRYELTTAPNVEPDRREILWAGFRRPEEVLRLPTLPHIRDYLLGCAPP